MPNADVALKPNCTADELIDVLEGNRAYIPCLYMLNKVDELSIDEIRILSKMPKSVFVSADLEWNLKGLVERIWDELDLIRIYTKPRGQAPDYNEPVVLPRKKCTVENFCNRIHKQILRQFKYTLVWGFSVKHFPQKVGREHTLIDEDIIQIIKKI